jgi:hypothetical protein
MIPYFFNAVLLPLESGTKILLPSRSVIHVYNPKTKKEGQPCAFLNSFFRLEVAH